MVTRMHNDVTALLRNIEVCFHGKDFAENLPDRFDFQAERTSPVTTDQKSPLNPLRSDFCVQWKCLCLAFTPRSVHSAADTGFYYLISALI